MNSKNEEALALYDRAILLDKNNGKTWYLKGVMHSYLGAINQAYEAYKKTLEIVPDHLEALCSFGRCLLDVGKYGEGLKYLEKALRINPDDYISWFNKANAEEALHQIPEAIKSYKRFLMLSPNDNNDLLKIATIN